MSQITHTERERERERKKEREKERKTTHERSVDEEINNEKPTTEGQR